MKTCTCVVDAKITCETDDMQLSPSKSTKKGRFLDINQENAP